MSKAALIERLQSTLGERCTSAVAVREQHGRGESWHSPQLPDAVVWPHSTEEVLSIVNACRDAGVPIIPFGAGTSLEGHVQAIGGGICVDFSQMNQVVAVNREDMDCVVQPGVTRKQLNTYLNETGLFFPVDPGADATIGGMASTRASGTNAVRYGTMREAVLGLTVVTADGQVIQTARRARKSSAGYDLTRLFVGAEGTLGLITEINLRLHPLPEAISSARVNFATVDNAVDTVIEVIQCAVPIARIELVDALSIAAINQYSKLDLPAQPTLFLEFHGTAAGVKEQAELVEAIAGEHGGGEFLWATKTEDRNTIWQARHDAYYAIVSQQPGKQAWTSDVCVPVSRLADCIRETRADIDASFLYGPMVGHVGDGNFHCLFIIDADNPDELAEAERLNERMVERALAMGGTCTGEHGIGVGKLKYLRRELGDAVDVMQQLKRALDPNNLFNPGKTVWG